MREPDPVVGKGGGCPHRPRVPGTDLDRGRAAEGADRGRQHADHRGRRLPADPGRDQHTFHAIRVRGHWSWILSPEQYADYSAGTCPYA